MKFKNLCFSLLFLSYMNNSYSQVELPFSKIPKAPKEISSSTITARMIQGLGFRYYWATEDLTTKDLLYRPSEDAKSNYETLEHIYSLALMINNATNSTPNILPLKEMPNNFESLRKETLNQLEIACANFLAAGENDIESMNIIFKRKNDQSSFPIWNLINGPISDAIYHTGQIISFRRTSGNPVPKGVNVFLGVKN
ncbi:MAG: hypothetical protein CMD32_02670 [Flavobacteriales bacterium]|nr:hypothetical protein [Flavobacteriales bacterium]|tara:strand:+ start:16295 stop:16885 length:591 start_codon:yes stop_codon:yes gene_type:complete